MLVLRMMSDDDDDYDADANDDDVTGVGGIRRQPAKSGYASLG